MLKEKLIQIISADEDERVRLIREFQDDVWNFAGDNESAETAILSDLAYDLDFYEPNEELRKEDISFYGEKRLKDEIMATLSNLEALGRK